MDKPEMPWLAIGRLEWWPSPNLRQQCTGTLIADHFVLTAAHCVFRQGHGENGLLDASEALSPEALTFCAFATTSDPGRCSPVTAILRDMTPAGLRRENDWAVLRLRENLGRTAQLKLIPYRPSVGEDLVLAGYSSDFGDGGDTAGIDPHCHVFNPPMGVWGSAFFGMDCDTMSGASGGPVLKMFPNQAQPVIIGISTFAVCPAGQTEGRYCKYTNTSANVALASLSFAEKALKLISSSD
jgi:V8-like Glu-specific endopeptidase